MIYIMVVNAVTILYNYIIIMFNAVMMYMMVFIVDGVIRGTICLRPIFVSEQITNCYKVGEKA